MEVTDAPPRSLMRTLLVLGRVSNLPTVWSNCFAGWLLGGGGSWNIFLELTLAATCLYVAGMYLNDAFDAAFDREHRPERPIPSGQITAGAVWAIGLGLLVGGITLLLPLGPIPLAIGATLAVNIILYDAVHKKVTFGPVVMAGCRVLLFLLAASAARWGVSGFVVWWSLALGFYIVGLSFIAKCESKYGPLGYWPLFFLMAPTVVAYFAYGGEFRYAALILSVALVLWIARSVRYTFFVTPPQIGRTVSSLLAGIPMVDLLAVGGGTPAQGVIFLGFLVLALVFQRYIPAT